METPTRTELADPAYVIQHVEPDPPIRAVDLGGDTSRATWTLQRLERAGYVESESRDVDGATHRVYWLTEHGARAKAGEIQLLFGRAQTAHAVRTKVGRILRRALTEPPLVHTGLSRAQAEALLAAQGVTRRAHLLRDDLNTFIADGWMAVDARHVYHAVSAPEEP